MRCTGLPGRRIAGLQRRVARARHGGGVVVADPTSAAWVQPAHQQVERSASSGLMTASAATRPARRSAPGQTEGDEGAVEASPPTDPPPTRPPPLDRYCPAVRAVLLGAHDQRHRRPARIGGARDRLRDPPVVRRLAAGRIGVAGVSGEQQGLAAAAAEIGVPFAAAAAGSRIQSRPRNLRKVGDSSHSQRRLCSRTVGKARPGISRASWQGSAAPSGQWSGGSPQPFMQALGRPS